MEEERIKFIKFSPSGSLNLFYMTPEQQMGKPLSILAKINNIETSICLDTSAGANAINTNYLKKLGINPIATKIFEKPIAMNIHFLVGLCNVHMLGLGTILGHSCCPNHIGINHDFDNDFLWGSHWSLEEVSVVG